MGVFFVFICLRRGREAKTFIGIFQIADDDVAASSALNEADKKKNDKKSQT